MLIKSIVFLADLEVALRMRADRAGSRSLGTHDEVTAVAALPHGHLALLEDLLHFHVAQQGAIALLVGLFDLGDQTELRSQLLEALFLSFLGHAVVHIGPLVVLAVGGRQQVLGGVAQLAQSLEPQLGVLLLIVGGLQEQGADLLIALLLGLDAK